MVTYTEIESIKKTILGQMDHYNEEGIKVILREQIASMNAYSTTEKKDLYIQVCHAIFGYGVIQPLLDDIEITEIMINGTDKIYIEKNGFLSLSGIVFEEKMQLLQLIHKICAEIGREVNLGSPILDARLSDGSRVNILLDPIALNGPIVTIRKFKKALSSGKDLMHLGMFNEAINRLFELLIQTKFNLFICGSTGSGKTTLLNCLSSYINPTERIITIEDAAEISLTQHENVVSLETRKSHQSSTEVNMSLLIKNALRMRPDRIIVGEVRGEEVIDMLQAMNTGHDGSLSTGHSNSAIDMLTRLEVIASSYSEINHLLIRKQIISAIDFIIFIEKMPDGNRKVTHIAEVNKNLSDYELNTLFSWENPENLSFENMRDRIMNQSKLRRFENEKKTIEN